MRGTDLRRSDPCRPKLIDAFCHNYDLNLGIVQEKVYLWGRTSLVTMTTYLEHSYSIVHQDNSADQPTLQEFKNQLEKGNDDTKVETMKKILTVMLSGDPLPNLLMHIIRFVMPSKSKPLKKLLYLYYEICPKLDAGGKLKQEMILVWSDCIRYESGLRGISR